MTAPSLAEMAGKLTTAQRAMVLTTGRGFADHAKGKWHGASIATARKLHALGLIGTVDTLSRPTQLGLALRAHLIAQEDQHD